MPELLDTVGLDAKSRKRKLREYSKGMARRIGLAQALINNPDLILLDEPTTGLDPIGTREMKDLILSLKAAGQDRPALLHLLADVQDVCDRITILFSGKMQTLGHVRDLLQVKDVTQIQARGLTPAADRGAAAVHRAGWASTDATVTHPTTTLEDLFIRDRPREHARRAVAGRPATATATATATSASARRRMPVRDESAALRRLR